MACEYILGVAMALFMGTALFLRLLGKRVESVVMESQIEERFGPRNGEKDWFQEDVLGESKSNDVIIVGAGVAGSALAYALAKDGRKVHVIERDLREQNRVVGETLQPGGYLKLVELGLKDCVCGIDAQPVRGFVLHKKGSYVDFPYPCVKLNSETVTGKSFHNGRFLRNLRNKAASLPNVTMEQGTVTGLIREEGTVKGVEYKTSTSQEAKAYAPLTIVCDGYFSNLRRSLCKAEVDKAKLTCHIVGWLMEDCRLPYADYGHLMMVRDSPCLVYRISSTETRFFTNILGEKLPSVSNGDLVRYIKTKVAPQMDPMIRKAIESTIDHAKIRAVPYYDMKTSPYHIPGAFLIGDAFDTRHPLIAGGMTVTLSDVVVIRDLLRTTKDLTNSPDVRKHLQSFYTLREAMSVPINTFAAYAYELLLKTREQGSEEVQDLFIESCRGCSSAEMAAAIVSGLKVHALHRLLFMCCLLSSALTLSLLPFPSPKRLWVGAKFIWVLARVTISSKRACRLTKQESFPSVG